MDEFPPDTGELAAEPCQGVCSWLRTGEVRRVDAGAEPAAVFACTGCGSQWLRSELWTPVDAGGRVPAAVAAELSGRPATSGPDGDAADSAGRCTTSGS
jgi:hypothetical protein